MIWTEKTGGQPSSDQIQASLRQGFDEGVDNKRRHREHKDPEQPQGKIGSVAQPVAGQRLRCRRNKLVRLQRLYELVVGMPVRQSIDWLHLVTSVSLPYWKAN